MVGFNLTFTPNSWVQSFIQTQWLGSTIPLNPSFRFNSMVGFNPSFNPMVGVNPTVGFNTLLNKELNSTQLNPVACVCVGSFSNASAWGETPVCLSEESCCCLHAVAPALLLVAKCFCFSVLFWFFSYSKVGLNVLVQRANKFTPATRLLIQRFVPFPAVGKK